MNNNNVNRAPEAKNKKLVWILFGVLALIIGLLVYWNFRQHQETGHHWSL